MYETYDKYYSQELLKDKTAYIVWNQFQSVLYKV